MYAPPAEPEQEQLRCGNMLPAGAQAPVPTACRSEIFQLAPAGRDLASQCASCHAQEQLGVMRGLGARGATVVCPGCSQDAFRLYDAGNDVWAACVGCDIWVPVGIRALKGLK
jgi:hypothetical protein